MSFNHWREGAVKTKLKFVLSLIVFVSPFLSYAQNVEWENSLNLKAKKIGGDFYFIGLQEVAEVLDAHTYYSNKARKAILYLGEEKITVTAFNPFVLIGGDVLQMPVETIYDDGEIYLPVKFFIPILKRVIGENGSLFVSKNGFDSTTSNANIVGIFVEDKANGTLIRVKTTQKFDRTNFSTRYSRQWLYLDIYDGKIDKNSLVSKIDPGLISQFVPLQMSQMVQLSFKLKKDISGREFHLSQQSDEIWLSIPSKDKLNSKLLDELKSDQEKWRIDKIVIDPGHGGRDPGAIGPSGVYEKNVVLEIGKKLRDLVEKNLDVDVVMTRDSDKYLSLKERTQLANKEQGKLFVSIHANWNRNPRVGGATTYFLGLSRSEESLEIAQRENSVIKYDINGKDYGDLTDENMILATMAQNAYNKESQDFAAMIQNSVGEETELNDRGVKQAGFYVLVGASMPNVLVETAFISNKKEEKLLKSFSFQRKVAQGIYESIKAFKERYE